MKTTGKKTLGKKLTIAARRRLQQRRSGDAASTVASTAASAGTAVVAVAQDPLVQWWRERQGYEDMLFDAMTRADAEEEAMEELAAEEAWAAEAAASAEQVAALAADDEAYRVHEAYAEGVEWADLAE